MNPAGRRPQQHLIDGQAMTVRQIADMLGITEAALRVRRNRLGGSSYQVIVNMYRENQFGTDRDRSARYMVDGQWMSRRQIADMLGIRLHTLTNWLFNHKGKGIPDAVAYYRQYQTGELKRHGQGGRKPVLYRVGRQDYTVQQVARMFGVARTTVGGVLRNRNRDMAATIRHFRERDNRQKRKAEKDILAIIMGGQS